MKYLTVKTKKPKAKDKIDPAVVQLQAELAQVREELRQAYLCFDQVTDGDLIEACIYKMNSAMAQCNYLVRTMKTLTCDVPDVPVSLAAAKVEDGSLWT